MCIINFVTFSFIFTGRNEVVAKVIFLHLSVILFTGGGSASMHAGIPTPPLGPGRPPPREADSRIRSTSGRYASYWNAFLLVTQLRRVECDLTSL